MKKIVYVTGCLGFIGSHVTRACLARGWYVIGVDICSYASNLDCLKEFEQHSNFKFIRDDINNLTKLYDCDYVINTAAETHVDNSIESSAVFVRSNIDGVHNLLELIRQQRIRRPTLLHFSTDEVYGDIDAGSFTESQLLKPSNPYSATKAAADQLILAWNRTHGVPYVIVRPTNNYGIGQYTEKLIPKTIKYLRLGRRVPLHMNGTPRRTWLHVADTADAILHIIDSGVNNEIYNISGNCETSNIEVVSNIINTMFENANVNDFLDFSYERAGADVRYSIDGSKLKALGWEARRNLFAELPAIVKYYQENFVW